MSKFKLPDTFIPKTDEEWEELSKKSYEDDINCPENFSNWYNEILDFGLFKHCNIVSDQVLTYEESKIMQSTDNIDAVDWVKIQEVLKPTLDKLNSYKLYNIKNGCFSNKFDFDTCICTKKDLCEKFWKINYSALMYGAGGYNELVVREIIPPYDPYHQLTIYNGMPLRTEVRVFYNMQTKEIEYVQDYWNYDYCRDKLSKTDSIIFDYFHNKLEGNPINHLLQFETICKYIYKYINSLKFSDKLKGIWSIDFMPILNQDAVTWDIYLIDMARGYRSAYWDFNKLKPETQKQLMEDRNV